MAAAASGQRRCWGAAAAAAAERGRAARRCSSVASARPPSARHATAPRFVSLCVLLCRPDIQTQSSICTSLTECITADASRPHSFLIRWATVSALDRLVAKAHRMRGCRIFDITHALRKAYLEQSAPDSLLEDHRGGSALQGSLYGKPLPRHLARVCRVNVTPTRVVCFPPEVEVTNRVGRLFGPAAAEECLLRVSFCDENMKAREKLSIYALIVASLPLPLRLRRRASGVSSCSVEMITLCPLCIGGVPSADHL